MTSDSDLRGTAETARDPERDSGDVDVELPAPGYRVGEQLGKGGMGEVMLARDLRIDRDVAFKRLRHSAPTAHEVARFLREAKIQARLDHPAIVPVFDIGRDADGRPYFTMRRLAGRTLHDRLDDAPTNRLLRAFVDVCLAVQYAHERGIVHRDLKPANIMLGDYGEVYIIDWGVARVVGTDDRASLERIGTLDGHTQAGTLLGTPGYMAPEQARGLDVGPPADVYALGAILFEVLAGDRLHDRDGAISSTLARPTQSPAARRANRAIAPELDAACSAALAEDPAARPTARSLADRVQRYLDGDRDLARRRTIAAEQLALARTALTAGVERRGDAMRAAGSALALEPSNAEAAALVGNLMLEPPRQLPVALAHHLDELDRDVGARTAHLAALATAGFLPFIPVLILNGVKSWSLFTLAYALIAVQIGVAEWMHRARRPGVTSVLVLMLALQIVFSRLWSPLIFLPAYINTVSLTVGLQPAARAKAGRIVAAAALAFIIPIALEAAGVLSPTWVVADDSIRITSNAVELGNAWSLVLLLGGNLVLIVVNALFGWSAAMARHDAQRELAIQAWHLRQMLPG